MKKDYNDQILLVYDQHQTKQNFKKKRRFLRKYKKIDKTNNEAEETKASGSKDKHEENRTYFFCKNLFRVKTRKLLPFLQFWFN